MLTHRGRHVTLTKMALFRNECFIHTKSKHGDSTVSELHFSTKDVMLNHLNLSQTAQFVLFFLNFTSAAVSASPHSIGSSCGSFRCGAEVRVSVESQTTVAGGLAGLERPCLSPLLPGFFTSRSCSICLYFFFRTRYFSPCSRDS